MIEKIGGRVVYAVLSFGGIFGMGAKHFPLPWEALRYDSEAEAYRVAVDSELLYRAPGFNPGNPPDMSDKRWGAQIHEYYGYRPYWERRADPRDEQEALQNGTTGILL
jgi:hypothetical protein